ncbi:MAG: ATP-binding protein [Planctomycetes bacterium]|nr:ATP-binding protein [Planctomycetota bacterium]
MSDPIHIERWMCTNCGLIIDYQFEQSEIDWPAAPGWPLLEPKLEPNPPPFQDSFVIDELCARCKISFEDKPPVLIRISKANQLADLLDMIKEGEGQELEFKEEFSTDSIRHTLAAFATSNGGKIIFGVNNQGKPVGYPDIDTPTGKDVFQARVKGLLGNINPKITIRVDFLSDKEKSNFALVTVPKGAEPVYYVQGKPYLRDNNESRPATPEEVKELIRRHKPTIEAVNR